MKIALITAGAAGMFCGSCLKDNTLAAGLTARGHDVLLIPTYTPLTLDEPDQSTQPIYLGGVNVFLDEYPGSRWLPGFMRRWLDSPGLLRFVTRFANSGDYSKLGELTISMLRGEAGRQNREIAELADHLAKDVHPDVIVLSNVLLSGIAPALKYRLPDTPIVATLQGDDLFLDALTSEHRDRALAQIRENYQAIAGTIATSNAYANRMADYLRLERSSIHVVRPGIRTQNYDQPSAPRTDDVLTIGYFARIAPEKGLDRLVAALRIAKLPPYRLRISGWLGSTHRAFLDKALSDHRTHCASSVEYVPCPSLVDKVRFLQSLDIFSVPAVFHEPKGIYVLEAMACGVPVVQPAHGSFPELIEMTGGGVLFPPGDDRALADGLMRLAADASLRRQLGEQGRAVVREKFSAEVMARETESVLAKFVTET